MTTTPKLSLPFLAPGQAQKELLHNESLQILDILVAATVEGPPLDVPPLAPQLGAAYIIGSNPVEDWVGHANQLVASTAGGWRYVVPTEGMAVFVQSAGVFAIYRGSTWDVGSLTGTRVVIGGDQVVGQRSAAIAAPASGSVVDAEARTAIVNILAAMRQHGLIEM